MNKNQKPQSLKLIWIGILVNLIISVTAIIFHFLPQKQIVYVDAIRLISKYKGMEKARKELEDKSRNWKSNMDTLQHEVEQAMAVYKENNKKTSVKEQQAQQELIQAKQQQFANYQDMIKTQYQKEDREKSEKILANVNDYVKRYGEAHGYPVVLAATSYGNIAYADKGLDITDAVLAGLNSEYAKLK